MSPLVPNGVNKAIESSLSYGCDSGSVYIGIVLHSLEEISDAFNTGIGEFRESHRGTPNNVVNNLRQRLLFSLKTDDNKISAHYDTTFANEALCFVVVDYVFDLVCVDKYEVEGSVKVLQGLCRRSHDDFDLV